MAKTLSPFTIWGALKGRLATLKTIHARYPKVTKRVRGLLPKSRIAAADKRVNKAVKTIAYADKLTAKANVKLLKYIKPLDKESRDSIRLLKAVMKSDFPVEYRKVWGRK